MKVFITGVNGQLGHDAAAELAKRGCEVIISGSGERCSCGDAVKELPYESLDITNPSAVEKVIGGLRPDAVIHCSAWTAVDAAEDEENRERVFALNAAGPKNIARVCKSIGAKLVYPSTDYVFNGEGTQPWRPDDRCTEPLNYYGETKLYGERAVEAETDRFFIVRIAWVFGINGKNFIKTMLNIGRTHDTLRVVSDQIGTPTYTRDLAVLLADMVETEKFGYYHASNEGGYISWYDFAKEIFAQAGYAVNLLPVTSREYGLNKAKRPLNSRLDKSKLVQAGFTPLPDWKDALSRYLEELKKQQEDSNGADRG